MADGQIDILIKTVADLSGGKLTEDQLAALIGKFKELNEVQKKQPGEEGQPGDAAGIMSDVLGRLAPLATAAGAVAAAYEAASKAVDAFSEHQSRVTALDAALRTQGNLTDEIREKYHALASQLESTTAVAEDRWLDVLARLTRFGANPDQIDKYAEAVKNLAGLMGTDIESAGHIFTRVMEGNFAFLHRYGIEVQQTGDKVKDLDTAMQAIAKGGAGVLEAQLGTLTGQFHVTADSAHHFWEAIGAAISQTGLLQAAAEGAHGSLDVLTRIVRDLTGQEINAGEAASLLANKLDGVADSAKKAAAAVKEFHEPTPTDDDLFAGREGDIAVMEARLRAANAQRESLVKQGKLDETQAQIEGENSKLNILDESIKLQQDKFQAAGIEYMNARENLSMAVTAKEKEQAQKQYDDAYKALADISAKQKEFIAEKLTVIAEGETKRIDILKKADDEELREIEHQTHEVNRIRAGAQVAAGPPPNRFGRYFDAAGNVWRNNTDKPRALNPATGQWENVEDIQKRALNPATGNYEDVVAPDAAPTRADASKSRDDALTRDRGIIASSDSTASQRSAAEQDRSTLIAQEKQTAAQEQVYGALDKTLETNIDLHQKTAKTLGDHQRRLKDVERDVDNLQHQLNSTRSR